jgi:hypothetical protein
MRACSVGEVHLRLALRCLGGTLLFVRVLRVEFIPIHCATALLHWPFPEGNGFCVRSLFNTGRRSKKTSTPMRRPNAQWPVVCGSEWRANGKSKSNNTWPVICSK